MKSSEKETANHESIGCAQLVKNDGSSEIFNGNANGFEDRVVSLRDLRTQAIVRY